jgi:hypothetical protein
MYAHAAIRAGQAALSTWIDKDGKVGRSVAGWYAPAFCRQATHLLAARLRVSTDRVIDGAVDP